MVRIMRFLSVISTLLAFGQCQGDLVRFEKEGCVSGVAEIRINAAYQDASGNRRVAHYKVPSMALTELTCSEKFLQAKKSHLKFTFGQDVLQLEFSAPAVSGKTISLTNVNYTFMQDPIRFYMTRASERRAVSKSYGVNDQKFGEWKKTYSCSGRLLDLGDGVNIELINMRLSLFNVEARSADVSCPTPYIATTPRPELSPTTHDFRGIGRFTTASPFGGHRRTTESSWGGSEDETATRQHRFTTRGWGQPRTTDSWDSDETTRRPPFTTRDWQQQRTTPYEGHHHRTTNSWDSEYTTRYPRYTTRDWHLPAMTTNRPWMHRTTESDVDPLTDGEMDWGRRTTRGYGNYRTTDSWRRRTTPDDSDDEAVVGGDNWGSRTTPRSHRYTTDRRWEQQNVLTTWAPLKK